MKTQEFVIAFLAGALAAHLWHWKDWSKKNKKSNPDMTKITTDVIANESSKYPDPLLKDYNIVMPSDQIAKKVREKAADIEQARYSTKLEKIKKPVLI